MFKQLKKMDERPHLWEYHTTEKLWTDPHISSRMLEFHLTPDMDPASRNMAFIRKSAAWMVSRFGIENGLRVADFGCGPGLYTTLFAESGASVTGIDFSASSLTYAREQACSRRLDIDYIQADYLDFKMDKRFDLITLIYCDLCPLSPQQRQTLLQNFHRHLADGGRVLLDVFSLKAFEERREASVWGHRLMDGFWSAKDYFGFLKTIKYGQEKVALDKYAIVEEDKTWEVYNWLQYYSRETLAGELEGNGFHIEEFFANVAGDAWRDDADEIAVVVQKKT